MLLEARFDSLGFLHVVSDKHNDRLAVINPQARLSLHRLLLSVRIRT